MGSRDSLRIQRRRSSLQEVETSHPFPQVWHYLTSEEQVEKKICPTRELLTVKEPGAGRSHKETEVSIRGDRSQ